MDDQSGFDDDNAEEGVSSTLQVCGVGLDTTNEALEEAFSDFGPLKRCFVVRPKLKNAKSTFGIVQFAISDDADRALDESSAKIEINGGSFSLKRIADKPQKRGQQQLEEQNQKNTAQRDFDRAQAKKKKARLIVRNLSFKATDAKLKSHFSTFGDVVDVNILKKKDGKMVGCAFVQYSNVQEAAKAIKELNGKPFLQRPVAIDWAVSKDRFQGGQKQDDFPPKIKEEEPEIKEEVVEPEAEPEPDVEVKEEPEDDGIGEESHSDQESEDDGGSDDDEEEEPRSKFANKQKRDWPSKGHDVSENKTVFIRNLSFNSDEMDLKDMLEQNFGRVLFARFVIDKATDHPKGTAFAKFANEDSVQKCIDASEGQDGLWLDGRQIYVKPALSPEAASKMLEEKKKKVQKDSRNLYLAREGLVREGTKAAEGVSKTDLDLRVNLEKRKRQMLKDLNRFISPTRLCFRNMPEDVTDTKLNKLVKKFAAGIKTTECKVMKDMKSGKSKGFGFVAFPEHEAALKVLRCMNNNPEVFRKDQRPIVEFSIENRKALNARQKRLEKSREKNPNFNNNDAGPPPAKKFKKGSVQGEQVQAEDEQKPGFMGSASKVNQKNLPSHVGPKIRHKKRTKISRKDIRKEEQKRKNPKKKQPKQDAPGPESTQVAAAEPPAKKKDSKKKKAKKGKKMSEIKDLRDEKKFTSMVNAYKQKLVKSEAIGKKRKWYD